MLLPDGAGPFPVVVLLHGGFWRAHRTLDLMRPLAGSLGAAGVAAWNLDYRAVGHDGGGWPGTLHDIAAGVAALDDLADRYPLDRDRVALVGHSAGGQLALWVAGPGSLPGDRQPPSVPVQPRLVVSLAGVCDLVRAAEQRLGDDAVQGFIGGAPDELAEQYRAASPQALVPLGVRQLLVHGTADTKVPVRQSIGYAAHARARGDDVELVEVTDADHMALVDPTSAAWRRTLITIVEILTT